MHQASYSSEGTLAKHTDGGWSLRAMWAFKPVMGKGGASRGALVPFQQQVVCGGQVVRTPPPILPEWLTHESVSAGVITEMYANS